MNINRFVNNPQKPFHSNGYAEVANGGAMGVQSTQSFEQRAHLERNRQIVRRYHDSHIGRGNELRVRPGASMPERNKNPAFPSHSRQISSPPRTTFTEPPARTYNPYQ